jgi:hypothetical protein
MPKTTVHKGYAAAPVIRGDHLASPRIGAPWTTQGGIFAGVLAGGKDAPDYCLVVADPDQGEIAWDNAVQWARTVTADCHTDFSLPTRAELRVLFANVAPLFEKDWYWSGEQSASTPDYAWYQSFYYGYQNYVRKGYELRARAVRRVPFSTLVIHRFE